MMLYIAISIVVLLIIVYFYKQYTLSSDNLSVLTHWFGHDYIVQDVKNGKQALWIKIPIGNYRLNSATYTEYHDNTFVINMDIDTSNISLNKAETIQGQKAGFSLDRSGKSHIYSLSYTTNDITGMAYLAAVLENTR